MNWFRKKPSLRATVIFPTFGDAPFARWPLESILKQSVKEIEIFIICDGSPPNMVTFFNDFAKDDRRISVFEFPKSPRTGEVYRDQLIRTKAKGKNIFYCCHDDLWFPDHIAELEIQLREHPFVNSIHVAVNESANGSMADLIHDVIPSNIHDASCREKLLQDKLLTNFFGLTSTAHTRKAYFWLKDGWTNTPQGIWTDLYMWRKFLFKYGQSCKTLQKATSLHFHTGVRATWTKQQRSEELKLVYRWIQDPVSMEKIENSINSIINHMILNSSYH